MSNPLLDIDKAAMVVFELSSKVLSKIPSYQYSCTHQDTINHQQSLVVMDQLMSVFTTDLPFGEDPRRQVLEKYVDHQHYNWLQTSKEQFIEMSQSHNKRMADILSRDPSLLSSGTHQWLVGMGREKLEKMLTKMTSQDFYGRKSDRHWSGLNAMEGADVEVVKLLKWLITDQRIGRCTTQDNRIQMSVDLSTGKDSSGLLKSWSAPEREAMRRLCDAAQNRPNTDHLMVIDFLLGWKHDSSNTFDHVVKLAVTGDPGKLQFLAPMMAQRQVDDKLIRQFLGEERCTTYDQYAQEFYNTVFTHPKLLPQCAADSARFVAKCITDRCMSVLRQLSASVSAAPVNDETVDVGEDTIAIETKADVLPVSGQNIQHHRQVSVPTSKPPSP